MKRSGGRVLVECLINQGVTTAFGVPGESYLDVLDALYDAKNQIRMIVNRHEGGSAFAAEAFGKLTGSPGICFVTRGPGATNAAIGVHTAMQNSSPMILFVGQIGRTMRDREAFQEVDYRSFFGGMAKWVTEIEDVDRIPELVARAFSVALSGRPGPVVIALPEDMLRDDTSVVACAKTKIATTAPDLDDVSAAIEILKSAKRPLMLVGGGGWNTRSRTALEAFAETNTIPVAVAFRSQDLIDNRSENYVGDAGVGMAKYLQDAIRNADVILGVNVRFGESTTEAWSLLDVPRMAAKLIHCHRSEAEINKIYQADIGVVSDQSIFLETITAAGPLGDWQNWRDECRQGFLKMRVSANPEGKVDMAEICRWLDDELNDDVVVTNGAGNFAIWPSKFITYYGDRRLLAPQSGAMGAGLPASLAAKAVDAARQVICFAGDGDFQMTLAELGTAVQENLRPIFLILNNGLYGTIRAHQAREYPGRKIATRIENPDFCALARAYGLVAARVDETTKFADAFRHISQSGAGGVIELIIDPDDISPFARLKDGDQAELSAQNE